jgi:7-cyano-7-deazaguanine synthase
MRNALVVLSGGQDSTTCLHWALKVYGNVEAITFDYGQKHRIEIDAAIRVAAMANVKHRIVVIPREMLLSLSPLTNPESELEEYANATEMDAVIGNRIEKTFVPMRNSLFLTIAANHAVANGIDTIITGICEADNANYPDCREEFRVKLQDAINCSLGSTSITIVAPLMCMSKADTCRMAWELGPASWSSLAYTHTSYDGIYPPTGKNHSNVLRAHGFEVAGLPDPLVLRAVKEGLMDLPDTANYRPIPGKESAL